MTDSDGFEKLGNKTSDWANNKAGKIADHPKRFLFLFIVVLIVIAIGGTILSLAKPWANEAKHVVSPENVTTQYNVLISDWQGLVTTADNACNAQSATTDSNSPTLVENPAFAYRATFFKIRSDYNTHFHDIFEGGLVGPRGYPHTVPDFPETHQAKGDWCNVSSELTAIHN